MPVPHLILVPGLMCDANVWQDQARELGLSTTITVPDHGLADSLGAMAEAIIAAAPARFAIAGHSMGGRVALEVIRRAPGRVQGMALLDTAYAPKAAGAEGEDEAAKRYALLDIARRNGTRTMGAVWVQKMVHRDRLFDTSLMNAILDMFGRKSCDIFAAQIKALLDRPDAEPLLGRIKCPTIVLCGRQDTWSAPEVHEQMAAMIPNSRLVVIEDCGHMSTMERPEEVTAPMQEWLTSLSA
jgi:pimeloyl-ACP methyl ester carboxylesterase